MKRCLTAALSLAIVGTGFVAVATASTRSTDVSYPVICVSRTVPWDPEPYKVCVPYPL